MFDRWIAFEKPAHQVDVIGQHVEHGREIQGDPDRLQLMRQRAHEALRGVRLVSEVLALVDMERALKSLVAEVVKLRFFVPQAALAKFPIGAAVKLGLPVAVLLPPSVSVSGPILVTAPLPVGERSKSCARLMSFLPGTSASRL